MPPETKQDVIASMQKAIDLAKLRFPELDARIELPFYGDPFEVDMDSEVVTTALAAVGESVGRPGEVMGFRGASDARFFSAKGAEVVVCGPGDIRLAHTAHESIDLDELERGALAYALAFARMLAPDDV